MRGEMYGLDPHGCRELAKLLTTSSQRLHQTSQLLSGAVFSASWQGPDSTRFRNQWPGQRIQLLAAARGLDDAAKALLRNVAEQERASSVSSLSGGSGGRPLDGLFHAGKSLWDDLTEGAGTVVDAGKSGLDWLGHELAQNPTVQNAERFVFNEGRLATMVLGIFDGNPPSASALVAQMVLTEGTRFNVVVGVMTGGLLNPTIFADGQPYAGAPVKVTNSSKRPVQLPDSISGIFAGVTDAYAMGGSDTAPDGDIRIVKVEQPDGSAAYIVNIPGTENWGAVGGGHARDLTSNLMLVSGQSTSASQTVALAMEKAGIPPDAPVMLTGHSQGGMLAADLSEDPSFTSKYNVTHVVTAGSPIQNNSIDPAIQVLAAQHNGDIVPKLDLGGINVYGQSPSAPSNVSVVHMSDPPRDALGNVLHFTPGVIPQSVQGVRDILANHDFSTYQDDFSKTDKYPEVAAYENDPSTRVFITNDASKVSAVDVPVGRR